MRQAISLILAVAVLGALASCGGATANKAAVDCSTYKFPSAMWDGTTGYAHRDEATIERRRNAADAVLDCQLLHGLNVEQVTRLLENKHRSEPETPHDWTYSIGPGRGPFSVDDEFLGVLFSRGRVVNVSISDG
jgi:hypothetical protein